MCGFSTFNSLILLLESKAVRKKVESKQMVNILLLFDGGQVTAALIH
jgi:hypothetical protein